MCYVKYPFLCVGIVRTIGSRFGRVLSLLSTGAVSLAVVSRVDWVKLGHPNTQIIRPSPCFTPSVLLLVFLLQNIYFI